VALDLGRVERALARLDSALEARALDGLDEQSLGALPVLGCACGSSGAAVCGAGGVMAWERGRGEGARGRGGR
jgi:hypothetical protein